MRITFFPFIAVIQSILLQVGLSFLFVIHLDMGIIGLALAVTLRDFHLCVITMLYCRCTQSISEVMVPFDMEALRGWGEYLSISIPATIMICAEKYAFESMTITAAILGAVELASITVI